jgi:phosphatidate cytidylyltransferase
VFALLFICFLISSSTDIFAYLFGVKFGKHKMAPHISPKKSWEGAIAGTLQQPSSLPSSHYFMGRFSTRIPRLGFT